MVAKKLIKNRNLSFLHPDIVKQTPSEEIESLIKAVGYFRNFSIFKKLYTLAYKSKQLSLENFRDIKNELVEYRKSHSNDYFIEGFLMCMRKSKRVDETKLIETFIVPFIATKSNVPVQLQKSIADYYDNSRPINLAVFNGKKIVKMNNQNMVKLITKIP